MKLQSCCAAKFAYFLEFAALPSCLACSAVMRDVSNGPTLVCSPPAPTTDN